VIRIPRGTAATLSHTFCALGTEAATDPTGTPTVAIVDANGTAVTVGTVAVVGGSTGRVSCVLPAQSLLCELTVTWTATVAGVGLVETDLVEVVSGYLFSLIEARNSDASLANTTTYPTADLTTHRTEVEAELETICDRAFVPRHRRAVLDGTGTTEMLLTDAQWAAEQRSAGDVRVIRSVRMADRADGAFIALSAGELAAVVVSDGMLRRVDGRSWTEGSKNIVVEYEYGLSAPPPDLKKAALLRLRSRLNLTRSGIPDRAVSFSAADGGTYRLSQPGAWATGVPEVDAALARWSRRDGVGGLGGRAIPASRTLTYSPQASSMFHRRRP
jgi:hypothetical protein